MAEDIKSQDEARASGQARLEAHIKKNIEENDTLYKDKINGIIDGRLVECSYEDKTLVMSYPIVPWQANRGDGIHGGILSTMIDSAIAVLARFYAGEQNYAPTVSLDVKFVRPAKVGDTLLTHVKATATGRRISQFTCEVYSKNTGKLIATAASVYMNVDTAKEKKGQ
jgi:uncharacterized protein (TIGR00369 family)